MRIIEQFVEGKSANPLTCEDTIVVTDNHIAVIDGATDISGKRYLVDLSSEGGGETVSATSGKYASITLAETIRNFDADVTPERMIELMSVSLEGTFNPDGSSPKAVAVIYSKFWNQILAVGDSSFGIFLKDGTALPLSRPVKTSLEQIVVESRALYAELIKFGAKIELETPDSYGDISEVLKKDFAGAYVMSVVSGEHVLANNPYSEYGFPVINGGTIPLEMTEVIDVPVDADYVVLHSDGYPETYATLDEAENRIEDIRVNDPKCVNIYKASRGVVEGNVSFDDRSYISFKA